MKSFQPQQALAELPFTDGNQRDTWGARAEERWGVGGHVL